MKIAVCVKQVPDTWAEKTLQAGDSTLDREGPEGVMNEIDEYAVEEALQLVETHGGDVTVVTMGPAKAAETVRKALSMGAEAGVHLVDDALHGSDALATSYALAELLKARGFDLVIFGSESTDARMSVVPAMVAERLGLPQVTFAGSVSVDGDTVTIERDGDTSTEVITASLPALVSVTDQINDPRYPSFKGIMAAKKKPVTNWTLEDLGVTADQVGPGAATTVVEQVTARPPRAHGQIVPDEGDGGVKLVEFLAGHKLV